VITSTAVASEPMVVAGERLPGTGNSLRNWVASKPTAPVASRWVPSPGLTTRRYHGLLVASLKPPWSAPFCSRA